MSKLGTALAVSTPPEIFSTLPVIIMGGAEWKMVAWKMAPGGCPFLVSAPLALWRYGQFLLGTTMQCTK